MQIQLIYPQDYAQFHLQITIISFNKRNGSEIKDRGGIVKIFASILRNTKLLHWWGTPSPQMLVFSACQQMQGIYVIMYKLIMTGGSSQPFLALHESVKSRVGGWKTHLKEWQNTFLVSQGKEQGHVHIASRSVTQLGWDLLFINTYIGIESSMF